MTGASGAKATPWLPWALALLLGAAGFLGNWYKLQLFLNLDMVFGSFFVMLAVARLAVPAALAVGVAAASCTLLLWNHPWAILIFSAEALFVAVGNRRRPGNLLLLDTLYWVLLGMPLVALCYHGVMGMAWEATAMVALKQAVNGIFNALLATLVLQVATMLRRGSRHPIPLREISLVGMAAVSLVPAFAHMTFNIHRELRALDGNKVGDLGAVAGHAQAMVNNWLTREQGAINDLAVRIGDPERAPRSELQRDVEAFRAARTGLLRVGVLDQRARSVAFSPLLDAQGRTTVGVDFSSRPYVAALRSSLRPVFPQVVTGRFGERNPILPLVAPIVRAGGYRGYCAGIVDFQQLGRDLQSLIQGRADYLVVLDQQDRVVFSTSPRWRTLEPFTREPGEERLLADGVRQWIPPPGKRVSIMQRWSRSRFLKQVALAPDRPWTVLVEASAAPAVASMNQVTLRQLLVLLVVVLITLPVSYFLTRAFVAALARVEAATREIPQHLAGDGQQWPDSNIQELRSLIGNFQALERRIAAAVAQLREKDHQMIMQSRHAAMGEMLGNIAHQWRQPLSALNMVLFNLREAAQAGQADPERVSRATLDGSRLISQMSTTITDFRSFFRKDKERLAFSALGRVRDTLALFQDSFGNDNITIDLQTDGDLLLLGIPNEYSQVLLNLVGNARDAILAQGRDRGRVSIRLDRQGQEGRTRVSDDGGGIPPDLLERIFEPYFTTKPQGTGLGLSMSKMIAERSLHGRLEARNLEAGAAFDLFLPLAGDGEATVPPD